MNSRLDEIQAAMLRVKLSYLDNEISARRKIAAIYLNNIKNPHIVLPSLQENEQHVWHLFVIKTKKRAALQQYLIDKGIETLIHYPIAPHKQEAYSEWNELSFPVTESLNNKIISLPISPLVTNEEALYIVKACNEFS